MREGFIGEEIRQQPKSELPQEQVKNLQSMFYSVGPLTFSR